MIDILTNKNTKILLFVLICCSIIAFAPALMNDFVNYDDQALLFQNDSIKEFSLKNTTNIFTSQYQGHYSRFNPLVFVVYSAIHHFAGFQPFAYHLTSLIFHVACVLAVFYLALLIAENAFLAFVTALLFAVHPIHVEPVAWASALMHVMYALFYLWAIIFYGLSIKYPARQFRMCILSFISFIVAGTCFSGGACTLPILLVSVTFYLEKRLTFHRIIKLVPFFILAIFFAYLTFYTAKNADIITNPYFNEASYSFVHRLNLSSLSILKYLQQAIVPYSFCIVYPTGYYAPHSNILITMSGLALLVLAFGTTTGKRLASIVRFGILFFLIAIAPFLQFYSTSDSIINDRYAYLASFGIFLVIAYALERLLQRLPKKFLPSTKIILCSILGYLIILTWAQTMTWKNGEKLWTNVITQYPKAYPAYVARAQIYQEIGLNTEAAKDLDEAIQIKPDYFEALSLRGNISFHAGDWLNAAALYTRALAVDNQSAEVWNNRANSYFLLKSYSLAENDYNKSISLDPSRVSFYYNRGIFFLEQKRYANALNDFQAVLKMEPSHITAGRKVQEIMRAMEQKPPL